MDASIPQLRREPKPLTEEQLDLISQVKTELDSLAELLIDQGRNQAAELNTSQEDQLLALSTSLLSHFRNMATQFRNRRGWRTTEETGVWSREERPSSVEAARHAWYVVDRIQKMCGKKVRPDWEGLWARAFQLKLCSDALRRLLWQEGASNVTRQQESSDDLVTLKQVADYLRISKSSLEKKKKDDPEFPDPVALKVPNGQAKKWKWAKFRIYLQGQFNRDLPIRFPYHTKGR